MQQLEGLHSTQNRAHVPAVSRKHLEHEFKISVHESGALDCQEHVMCKRLHTYNIWTDKNIK